MADKGVREVQKAGRFCGLPLWMVPSLPGFHDLGGPAPPVTLPPLLLSCRASSTTDASRLTSAEMGLDVGDKHEQNLAVIHMH